MYTNRHPNGQIIKVNEAEVGDLVSELFRDGSARFGIVVALHGGAVSYRDDDGRIHCVPWRRMGSVDRPINPEA